MQTEEDQRELSAAPTLLTPGDIFEAHDGAASKSLPSPQAHKRAQ